MERSTKVNLSQLGAFDEIIDVRSPGEYAEDHIPGAVNFPVLDDGQRAQVGTLYKQVSPFEAKKLGASLIARNIGTHIENALQDRPRDWRPLVYCWRGGSRSGAMTHILRQVGWRAMQLEGGYKQYRRQVVADLAEWPGRFHYQVVCGLTGTGKSRLLLALKNEGGQVLDLEDLAAHRGSVLGYLPDAPQPSQKMFESRLWHHFRSFDPHQPVYVEAESKKIGNVRLPDALLDAMWSSPVIRLEADFPLRIQLLKEEYAHFLQSPALLHQKLAFLTNLYGREQIERWKVLSEQGNWDELIGELLARHYDPAYSRSIASHYPRFDTGLVVHPDSLDGEALSAPARHIREQCEGVSA